MTNQLRVLLVDDSPEDIETIFDAFRKLAPHARTHAVSSLPHLEAEIAEGKWNVVLTELRVGELSAEQILTRVAARDELTPVIVLAREFSDEEFRHVMTHGACDTVRKGDWVRLICAIEREVRVADRRREAQGAETSLRALESRYRAALEQSSEAMCHCHDGILIDANPAFLELFGFKAIELFHETPILSLVEKCEQPRFKKYLRGKLPEGESPEFKLVRRDGGAITAEVGFTQVSFDGQDCLQIRMLDVSSRKALESRVENSTQRDGLTGLPVRHCFLKSLTDSFVKATEGNPVAAAVGIELKGLRRFNEEHGHAICDKYILTVAQTLIRSLPSDCTLARVGGGQFAALLPATSKTEAERGLARLTGALAELRFSDGEFSINVDYAANMRLITDKDANRDRFMRDLFPPLTAHRVTEPATPGHVAAPAAAQTASRPKPPIEAGTAAERLKAALAANKLALRFQAIVALTGDLSDFYEVQLAVPDEHGQPLSREVLGSALESDDAAAPIDRWCVSQAVDRLADQHKAGRKLDFVVGLSAHAPHDSLLLNALAAHLKSKGIKPKRLHLRVPASALLSNPDTLRDFTARAAEIGVKVVLGDVRPETFSNPAFAKLHLDAVEVDCGQIGGDPAAMQEASRLCAAAKAAGKSIIATDITAPDLVGHLFGLGIEFVQGDCLAQAGTDLDQPAVEEQTLEADSVPGRSWRSAG
jgi:diguanylate cyclase (GGDEF)-like protein/PAS domain S-box-containing protein